MIKTQTYSIKNQLLSNQLLITYINRFWEECFSLIKDSKHLMLLVKVEFLPNSEDASVSGYRSLANLRKVNYSDKDLFIEYLIARIGLLTETYVSYPISKIEFSYIVRDGLVKNHINSFEDDSVITSSTTHRFTNLNLPISMKLEDYGTIILNNYVEVDGVTVNRFIVQSNKNKRAYQIDVSNEGLTNTVTILGAVELSWTDTLISSRYNLFKREIGKSIIYFLAGERILTKRVLPAKPFTKVSTDKRLADSFTTMDIETVTLQGKVTPYLICAYNGTSYITSYASNNDSLGSAIVQKELFTNFITQLNSFFVDKNRTLVVYAHNLSTFDGILLLKHLVSLGKVEPLLHNGKIIKIKFTRINVSGLEGKTIIFKDSMLLLPQGLRQLCQAFNITVPKSYFPFKLTDVFYNGIFPKFEYWTGISHDLYLGIKLDYRNKYWNFKEESIKYCKLDCKCLHQILIQFNELIFNEFKVNIHNSLTLPSLAIRIYKSQFMPENTIYQILGNVEKDIRQSYTGGAVDVFIPHNNSPDTGRPVKIYGYDINALYPTIMAKVNLPIGKPIAFEGDIRAVEPKAFGFFFCKITSPEFLEHPILQRRIKTNNGIRTIAGLGSWTGWISSLEMDNAIKLGYSIEIIRGYQFEVGNIFKDYVHKMYNLRLQYERSHPMNYIAKLLQNSLYGKLGMKLESTVVEFWDTSDETSEELFLNMLDTLGETINDYVKIDNFYIMLRKRLPNIDYDKDLDF